MRRLAAMVALASVSTAGCHGPAQKAQDAREAGHSWAVSADAAVRAWQKGLVPRTYACAVVERAALGVEAERQRLAAKPKEAALPEIAATTRTFDALSQALARLVTAMDAGDGSRAAAALAAVGEAAGSLRPEGGP